MIENVLKMADDVYERLADGKAITIRYGKREFADELIISNVSGTKVCDAEKVCVKHYTLYNMPFEDLLADGFQDMEDAYVGLKRFYPDLTMYSSMTVLHFRLLADIR